MAREPEELVEMRRVLGAQLATFRQAAELTQKQLARVALVDRTTVAHIEKGRSRADERFWTVVDAKCQANGVLLAGFHAWETAKQEYEVRVREAQLTKARARAEELRATISSRPSPQPFRVADCPATSDGQVAVPRNATPTGPDFTAGWAGPLACASWMGSLAENVPATVPDELDEVIGQLARSLCGWIGGMNRRTLLQLLRWTSSITAVPAVVGLNADEQERLAKAIAAPSRVDEQVITHIETIHRYCKQQDDALGSRAVVRTVLAQHNLVHDLLVDCPPLLRSRLLTVYSDMSSSIAYYMFDLNDFDSSRYYYDQARVAAGRAGNVDLGVYALSEMGYTASWQGDARTAIDLAAAAKNLTSNTGDPLLNALVAQTAGVAFAVGNQYKASMMECEKAEAGLVSTGLSSTESPAYSCNEGLLARLKSECLLRLGKPQKAAVSATRGLTVYKNSPFAYGAALCNLNLGNACLESAHLDEAACAIGDAAKVAVQIHSARLVREVQTTRARMEPWRRTQAVKTLDDQLTTYGVVTSLAT